MQSITPIEKQFQSVADTLKTIIWSANTDGVVDYTNSFWKDFTDINEDSWHSSIHPDDKEQVKKLWDHSVATGIDYHNECRFRNRNGDYVWYAVHSSPVRNEEGRIVRWHGWGNSIDKEKQASNAKDHFLAVLSHELRTPLTPILAAIHLIEMVNTNLEINEEVQAIKRNVELESRLIDDLLDLTRIARGKITLHFEAVDVHEIIENTLHSCGKDQICDKKLNVIIKMDAQEHYIWADPVRLQQILWNLVSNAFKFTPQNGSVIISTVNENRNLIVSIEDNGIGIDPDTLPRLFNAFEQGEKTVTRKFGGLGLGLAITKSLVDMHQANIFVSSDGINKGSCFRVVFKTIVPMKESLLPPRKMVKEHHASILLVDDHPDTLWIMAKLLAAQGYKVDTAGNVAQAIQKASANTYDVLVSDIGLPDGSGHDVVRYVRSRMNIHAVALSGFGQEEDKARSREAGFNIHLVKPVNVDELHRAINQMLAA